MISYHNGDLLQSKCDVICHQVNLQGIMGGGLALQIAKKYHNVERDYKIIVQYYYSTELLNEIDKTKTLSAGLTRQYLRGKYHICKICDGRYIFNCFTQEENFDTNYELVKECFESIKNYCLNTMVLPVTIGVPYKYGCGIAKGEWDKVEQIFKDIYQDEKFIDFQIWKLE